MDVPRRMSWRMLKTTAPAWGHGSYLEEVAGGTRMKIHMDYEPRNRLGRLRVPVLGKLVLPRTIDGFLRQLKRVVEASSRTTRESA